MSISDEIMGEHLTELCQLKEHYWKEHGERDIPDMLVIQGESDTGKVVAVGGELTGFELLLDAVTPEDDQVNLGEVAGVAIMLATGQKIKHDSMINNMDAGRVLEHFGDQLPKKVRAVFLGREALNADFGDDDARNCWTHDEAQQDFDTNPASEVSRALAVTCWTDDLVGGIEHKCWVLPYKYDDGGVIAFDDSYGITVEDDEINVHVVAALEAVMGS